MTGVGMERTGEKMAIACWKVLHWFTSGRLEGKYENAEWTPGTAFNFFLIKTHLHYITCCTHC